MRLTLIALVSCLFAPAYAAQYWVGGRDPVMREARHLDTPADYMELFAPDAPWQRSRSRLSVFSISTQLILRGSGEMLHTIFDTMHRRGVAVSVSIGAVVRTAECGGGESFAPPDLMDRVGRKLHSLGLMLDDMAMDSPVWGAHERSWGRNDCVYPVPEVVRRVVQSVTTMRRYFPALRVGEIESVGDHRGDARRAVEDYVAFQRMFREQTGTPIAFLHADTVWQDDWQPMMRLLARAMHAQGTRLGVFVGTGPGASTDAMFVEGAMQNLARMAADPQTRPDDVIVYSWQVLPSRMLPETEPSATGLLLRAETLTR